jgi:hypothetical protein
LVDGSVGGRVVVGPDEKFTTDAARDYVRIGQDEVVIEGCGKRCEVVAGESELPDCISGVDVDN